MPAAGRRASFARSGMPSYDSSRWTTCLALPCSALQNQPSPGCFRLSGSKLKVPEGWRMENIKGLGIFALSKKNQTSRKHIKPIWDVRYCKNIAHRNSLKANLWHCFSSCIRQLSGKSTTPSSSGQEPSFVGEVPLLL